MLSSINYTRGQFPGIVPGSRSDIQMAKHVGKNDGNSNTEDKKGVDETEAANKAAMAIFMSNSLLAMKNSEDMEGIFDKSDFAEYRQYGVFGWVPPIAGNEVVGILRDIKGVKGKYGERRAFTFEGAAKVYVGDDAFELTKDKRDPDDETIMSGRGYRTQRGAFIVGDMAYSAAISEMEVGKMFHIVFLKYDRKGDNRRKTAYIGEIPLEKQVGLRSKLDLEPLDETEGNPPPVLSKKRR